MTSPENIHREMHGQMMDLKIEQMWVLYLNNSNYLIKKEMVCQGTMNYTPVDIQRIVRGALELGSNGLVLVHNHPSGQTKPSQSDINTTKQVRQACKLFNIRLLDHLIYVDKHTYYSFDLAGQLID